MMLRTIDKIDSQLLLLQVRVITRSSIMSLPKLLELFLRTVSDRYLLFILVHLNLAEDLRLLHHGLLVITDIAVDLSVLQLLLLCF